MIIDLISGFFWPAFWALLIPRVAGDHGLGWRHMFWVLVPWSAAAGVLAELFLHRWWALPGYLFWIAAAIWHHTRKRRDRAKVWLGAKSRALRDALVRKARELSQPRPVLRPIPQGAS